MKDVPQVTVEELNEELRGDSPPVLLDVREDDELKISKLDYQHHIPVDDLRDRVDELSPDDDIVVICRTGLRSGNATMFLREKGFTRVRYMFGGMNEWSERIDPTMRQY